jgi:serine O-acetyltransferase
MSDHPDKSAGVRELLRADWAAMTFVFPHFFAVAAYRVSHALWRGGHVRLSRLTMVISQVLTGAEISGAATIGADLTLYACVLLGNQGPRNQGRPTLGDGVRVCSKASVLGPVHVGDGAFIGAHALVTGDVPA